jgi:hypothetical protein
MDDASGDRTLSDAAGFVRRRWLVIVIPIVLVPLFYLAGRSPETSSEGLYEGRSKVFIGRFALSATITGNQEVLAFAEATRLAQTQAELSVLPIVVERTLRATGVRHVGPRQIAEFFARGANVVPSTNADFIHYTARDPSPSQARALADAWARQATRYRRQLDTATIRSALRAVERRLEDLRSQGDRQSAVYHALIDKEQQLHTMNALQLANGAVVEATPEAVAVETSSDESLLRKRHLALLVGAALGGALALLAEMLDPRLRSPEDAEELLALPLLARLPKPDDQSAAGRPVVLADPGVAEAEAFRALRTAIEMANAERQAKVIALGTVGTSEGASLVVANLAVAFARAGRRVAAVDLAVRRPLLRRLFGLPSAPGLHEVALGEAELDDAATTVAVSRDDARNGRGDLEVRRNRRRTADRRHPEPTA